MSQYQRNIDRIRDRLSDHDIDNDVEAIGGGILAVEATCNRTFLVITQDYGLGPDEPFQVGVFDDYDDYFSGRAPRERVDGRFAEVMDAAVAACKRASGPGPRRPQGQRRVKRGYRR